MRILKFINGIANATLGLGLAGFALLKGILFNRQPEEMQTSEFTAYGRGSIMGVGLFALGTQQIFEALSLKREQMPQIVKPAEKNKQAIEPQTQSVITPVTVPIMAVMPEIEAVKKVPFEKRKKFQTLFLKNTEPTVHHPQATHFKNTIRMTNK